MRPRYSVDLGRHKAGIYRIGVGMPVAAGGQAQGRHLQEFDGNGGRGLAKPFRLGTCWNIDTRSTRHVVGEGALRGRSPRTREGRIGPTARNCSGQWSVVSEGPFAASRGCAEWPCPSCCLRCRRTRLHFGMHPSISCETCEILAYHARELCRPLTRFECIAAAARSRRTLTPNRFYITFTNTCQQGLAGYGPRQSRYRRLVSEREKR